MSYNITYFERGRTGNNLFQWATCKVLGYIFGHTYVISMPHVRRVIVDDNLFKEISESEDPATDIRFNHLRENHIECNGFFQLSKLFVKYRERLIQALYSTTDIIPSIFWQKVNIFTLMHTPSKYILSDRDVVVSLRLDDFYHPDGKQTDIPYPNFYLDIIKTMNFDRLYIVCDKINKPWEQAYLNQFKEYNPILVSGTIEDDVAVLRDAKRIIHSNSTLCWFISFASEKMERHIPLTGANVNQYLDVVSSTDKLYKISTMKHNEINNL